MVLSCRRLDVADGVVRRLRKLERLDDFSTTSDIRWMHECDLSSTTSDIRWIHQGDLSQLVFVDPAHASAGKDWLCTAATPPHAVEGREWTVPGWWTGATTWTAQQVDAAGLGATRAIEQVRAWQFSRVLQVKMQQECLSFRARQGRMPARRESESQVVYHLARRAVTFVPDVLAVNSYARGF